ncbi:hypothetical protein D4S03_09165 [bacterium]|nr:MAG: hypothetical protein D4S03_09165 [bacterium]
MNNWILMIKDGEEKFVAPGNMGNHERAGWVVASPPASPPAPLQNEIRDLERGNMAVIAPIEAPVVLHEIAVELPVKAPKAPKAPKVLKAAAPKITKPTRKAK